MNSSAAKSIAGNSSQANDLNEFERRLRGPEPLLPEYAAAAAAAASRARDFPHDAAAHDPLAALAALVNSSEDPFRDLFDEPGPRNSASTTTTAAPVADASAPMPPVLDRNGPAPLPERALAIPRDDALQVRTPADQEFRSDENQSDSLQSAYGTPLPDSAVQNNVQAFVPGPVGYGGYGYDDLQTVGQVPRGTLPEAEADPIDEFERSVAQLVAAHKAGSEAPSPVTAPAPVSAPAGLMLPEGWEADLDLAPPPSARADRSPAPGEYETEFPEPADGPAGRHPAVPPEWIDDNDVPPPPLAEAGRAGGSRKSLYLMGGALAILVVGIGGTLANLYSNGAGRSNIPTITASNETLKVKIEADPASKPVRNVSILQTAGAKPMSTKVVTGDEQPIDLAQVPPEPKKARRIKEEELSRKLNLRDRNVARPIATTAPSLNSRRNASGYFPEPRRVRTVMVRPDGTLIDPTASIPVRAAPRPEPVQRPPTAAPAAQRPQPVAAPAPVRGSTARKVTSRAASAPARKTAARPVRSASQSAPVNLQGAVNRGGSAAAPGSGYAVQLAAPANEAAARSVANQMKSKYGSVLGGRSPSVQRAVVGKRTVYRVRVNGLSRGGAAQMCSQLQSRGGKCFVARN